MAFPFAGLKKQLNKANQYMSERITGVEGTKLNNEFQDMERRTDVFNELVEDLQIKTKEYLQPNPTVRAKMAAVKGISKLSGQAKASTYPQPEGTLGEAMCSYGRKLQDCEQAEIFAAAMSEMGESMKQLADLKYALDDNVKQNFLEPLHHTQSKDLKEVMHHRKKLQGRKLDYDCKRRKGAPEEEIRLSEDKFSESLQLAQLGMHNLMDGNGVEHISQLSHLAESLLEYHKNCAEVLQSLTVKLNHKMNEASARPRVEFKPKTLEDLGIDRANSFDNLNNAAKRPSQLSSQTSFSSAHSGNNFAGTSNLISTSPSPSPSVTPTSFSSGRMQPSPAFDDAWGQPAVPTPLPRPTHHSTSSLQPSCRAIYDFDAENPAELSFKENDVILLKSQIDENWFEGSIHGRTGYFPVSYVTVLAPLPKF